MTDHVDEDWISVKNRFPVGFPVTGRVIASQPFGVFIDIGVGIPQK